MSFVVWARVKEEPKAKGDGTWPATSWHRIAELTREKDAVERAQTGTVSSNRFSTFLEYVVTPAGAHP